MKTVTITGISRGIGRALVERFLSEGFAVIGTTKDGSCDLTHEQLTVFQLELSDPDSIDRCGKSISEYVRANGHIDILINNAGALFDEEEIGLVIPKLRQTLEVNLIGTADLTEKIIPAMADSGHIIFVSSAAGSLADMDNINDSHYPYHYPAYKISKCALNMYMRTLAARLNHEGSKIIVSAVHPGWVKTDMGGEEAPVTPAQAAEQIGNLAKSRPETGQFWFNGQKFPF